MNLTVEQLSVIQHPSGKHARVLAVAGSGKTTAMVYRIQYLINTLSVNPRAILVLMFNKLARRDFKNKLHKLGLELNSQPPIHTFHSFAFQFISEMENSGLFLAPLVYWNADKAELVRHYMHQAIKNLESQHRIQPKSVDVDDAIEDVGLWKGSLILPLSDRAGHMYNPQMPLVYEEFERLRIIENALSYDDFIPMTVQILEGEESVHEQWANRFEFIIVDEYQDVNYGQQYLIETLAGERADVMVVGDDDQTIYEWRGARPDYITSEFKKVFCNKPNVDYTLNSSFRFGPSIAQCADNVISCNHNRLNKNMVAHELDKTGIVQVIKTSSEQDTAPVKELAQRAKELVRETNDPRQVIVLCRMFSQLSGIEAEFLNQGIPYRVVGRQPFFERREIQVLLNYIKLSTVLDEPPTTDGTKLLLSVANTPNRKISKDKLTQGMVVNLREHLSIRDKLIFLTDNPETPLSREQQTNLTDLVSVLDRLKERIREEPELSAANLLDWLVKRVDYFEHFNDYYGKGEHSEDRKRAVTKFCDFAKKTRERPIEFVKHVARLDPTHGKPEDQQIVMTTIFRTKGLDFDYVIIPSCEEGYLPCLVGDKNPTYDKAGTSVQPESSEAIENERRLFYVAVTRAKKGVFIGTSEPPEKGSQENSLPAYPSRFIWELRHEATTELLNPLQHLVRGDGRARKQLEWAIQQFGGVKSVVRKLIEWYLPAIGENALAKELGATASKTTQLIDIYPPGLDFRKPVRPSQHNKKQPWWKEENTESLSIF